MKTLYLVCDASGSMVEGGKRFILRNLVRSIDQYYRLRKERPEIKLVLWSDESSIIDWVPGEDVPDSVLKKCGNLDPSSLITTIGDTKDSYFLFLTDGYWDRSTRSQIGAWKDSLGQDSVRMICVGADANPRMKGSDIYHASELLAALKGWMN